MRISTQLNLILAFAAGFSVAVSNLELLVEHVSEETLIQVRLTTLNGKENSLQFDTRNSLNDLKVALGIDQEDSLIFEENLLTQEVLNSLHGQIDVIVVRTFITVNATLNHRAYAQEERNALQNQKEMHVVEAGPGTYGRRFNYVENTFTMSFKSLNTLSDVADAFWAFLQSIGGDHLEGCSRILACEKRLTEETAAYDGLDFQSILHFHPIDMATRLADIKTYGRKKRINFVAL